MPPPEILSRFSNTTDDDYALPRISIKENRKFNTFVEENNFALKTKTVLQKLYRKEKNIEGKRRIFVLGKEIYSYNKYKKQI